jgi:hypothetical protein
VRPFRFARRHAHQQIFSGALRLVERRRLVEDRPIVAVRQHDHAAAREVVVGHDALTAVAFGICNRSCKRCKVARHAQTGRQFDVEALRRFDSGGPFARGIAPYQLIQAVGQNDPFRRIEAPQQIAFGIAAVLESTGRPHRSPRSRRGHPFVFLD